MSTVVQKVTAKKPFEVIERKILWSGGIIKIKVPAGALKLTYSSPAGDVRYLQFAYPIKKGQLINLFVLSDIDCRGKDIIAETTVMQKRLSDDRQFLYVDLKPVTEYREITHRLVVLKDDATTKPDWIIFDTPPPMNGLVVLIPPDEKISSPTKKGPAVTVSVPVQNKVPKVVTPVVTGDGQLDRLIAQGWKILEEKSSEVKLWRDKKGGRVTMTHIRQKKKPK